MKKKYYLSDLFLVEALSKNNLIIAPVGSGKTHFVFNELIPKYKGKKLYLCDNENLEQQVIVENSTKTSSKKTKYEDLRYGFGDKVEVMCYNAFAKQVSNLDINEGMKIIEKYDLIIADEIHNLIDYQKFTDSKDLWRLMELLFTKKYNNTTIVLMTATPYYVEKLKEKFSTALNGFNIFDFDKNKNIKRYIERRKVYINHINQIENQLQQYEQAFQYADMKCLIYTKCITDMKKIEAMCLRLNLTPICIWSTNNSKHKLNKEQEEFRNFLVKHKYIKDPYNVLIINKAMETGINIEDEDQDIGVVIVNTTNITEQIQARGRVRHDIDLIIVRTNNSKEVFESNVINLNSKWLNRPLTRQDKEDLCTELHYYNDCGRPIKWTTIKKILKENGYTIKSIKPIIDGKRVNCEIIKKER